MVDEKIKDIVASELGSRPATNSYAFRFVSCLCFLWAMIQFYAGAPIGYNIHSWIGVNVVIEEYYVKILHLFFGVSIGLLTFPISKKKTSSCIPWYDWLLLVLIAISFVYPIFYRSFIAENIGYTTTFGLLSAVFAIAIVIEVARRILGSAIIIVAISVIIYTFFGRVFPDIIAHAGQSVSSVVSQLWFSSEGIYGTALSISADFIFLYVLFGSLLERTGCGQYFIRLSFAILNRFTAGPAKASVVASGLMGMISGSSIANTITVGTLTIPIMVKMGLAKEKAAAIEVSAGVNSQIMPPVMGAAAFVMAEYLSIPYDTLIKNAFLPAFLIYIALIYLVHLEGKKQLLSESVSSEKGANIIFAFFKFAVVASFTVMVLSALYFIIEGTHNIIGLKNIAGKYSLILIACLIAITYILLLKINAERIIKIDTQDISSTLNKNDPVKIFLSGLHCIIPIIVLVWCLMIEHLSPSLSAYWTIIVLMFMMISKDSLLSYFTTGILCMKSVRVSLESLYLGFVHSSRNMVVVAIATAMSGIIVGCIAQTGIGLKLGSVIFILSQGKVIVTLILTAIICISLGIGMPTTACYIIVSNLMVPILSEQLFLQGIVVSPVALHLFVFYFGLMADITPPVGLASFTASAIAKSNPMKTGVQAFVYNLRTMLLPFVFIFNNGLLMIDYYGINDLLLTIIMSLFGIILFSAGLQGFFHYKNTIFESVILLLLSMVLLFPVNVQRILVPNFTKVDMSRMDQTLLRDALDIEVSDLLYGNRVVHINHLSHSHKSVELVLKEDMNLIINDDNYIVSAPAKYPILDASKLEGINNVDYRISRVGLLIITTLLVSMIVLKQNLRKKKQ
ncbi:MAG: trap transporter, 4tm/12tm fusion protein [Candidatus Xenolissoclinum pacificiensis L6]|uniref:Trap transporter, 4tm/12tm fusion protein n=1 Tax=Candidatus Xenolissoclinum pacificiensis L6 TaxID=1401685 RepID=W2UZH0_9RICK|nr:MAG: trap transporter, 4tm/12tm fusion protein [Candidatus Xenolissoclinum pacificiensis L6]